MWGVFRGMMDDRTINLDASLASIGHQRTNAGCPISYHILPHYTLLQCCAIARGKMFIYRRFLREEICPCLGNRRSIHLSYGGSTCRPTGCGSKPRRDFSPMSPRFASQAKPGPTRTPDQSRRQVRGVSAPERATEELLWFGDTLPQADSPLFHAAATKTGVSSEKKTPFGCPLCTTAKGGSQQRSTLLFK